MAKALAGLFAGGATLALLTIVLPHQSDANELGLSLICIDAFFVAAGLFWGADRAPRWVLPLALAWGTASITGVAYFSAENPGPLVFFYLWIFLYSAYFLTRAETILQITLVGIFYFALLLAQVPSDGIAAWWIVGMGAMQIAAILILSMRRRVDDLIGRLYESARIDPLTKLLNRRGFRELLDLELERARRSELPLSVVIGDVDYFKEVNDSLGHPAGDAALSRLAKVIEDGKRLVDAGARVGGEEFAMVLPDTDAKGAFILAERMRREIEAAFLSEPVPITISFGIACYPEHAETAGALLRAGDEALYAAKEAGRNRTLVHDPSADDMYGRPRRRSISGERYLAVLLNLAEAIDLRLSGSARHSETVGRYAEMMATELGLSDQQVRRIKLAGILHDIGKIGVPDSILNKPGALDDDEWEIVKGHPEAGARILEHPDLTDIRDWVGSHHERPDGKGYPRGIAADELPLEARILAVADAYEAMTSDRSYRRSIGREAAREELRRCCGSQFDPGVVDALLRVIDREPRASRTMAAA